MSKPETTPKSPAIEARVRQFEDEMRAVYQTQRDDGLERLLELLTDSYKSYLVAQAIVAEEGSIIPGEHHEARRHPAMMVIKDCRYSMLKLHEQLREGRENSKLRMAQADADLEDALCSGPSLIRKSS